jgi:hypothetical protein
MPSAANTSNSSNIKITGNSVTLSQSVGSRLTVLLSNESSGFLAPGLTGGDVIRYDISLQGYTRSCADTLPNSEVFGIVESKNTDGSLNVVTYGSIKLTSNRLLNLNGFNYGGNDVYFLSDTIPGFLQNLPPSGVGKIIKPVYQTAPHGAENQFSGTVMNYVGYVIQGI